MNSTDKTQLPRTIPRDVLRHPIALYTMVDAQCDKLATIVSWTKLTTLATVDGLCRSKYRVWY